jgi:hypothetical protein
MLGMEEEMAKCRHSRRGERQLLVAGVSSLKFCGSFLFLLFALLHIVLRSS